MKYLKLVIVTLALGAAVACGSSGSLVPDPLDLPPGTNSGWVLVAPKSGESIEPIVAQSGGTLLGAIPGTGYYRVAVPADTGMMAFRHQMGRDARVRSADPDVGMSAPEGDGSTLPAGGLLVGSAIAWQTELLRIGADVARERATGLGVRVAVLDTGMLPHEVTDASVDADGWDFIGGDPDPLDEPDGLDSDADGLVDESHAHGLFVASLIVAVAPDARIVPFRVLDADGIGHVSAIATAIWQATDLGAHVINLSVSMENSPQVLREAVASARVRGVCVVASAGNTGVGDVNYPAALPETFSVTAVDAEDARAEFASFGAEVDLSAPGVDLLGAYPSPSGTARWSGTSFSAALVSGAVALLHDRDPGADPALLLQRLIDTAAPLAEPDPTIAVWLGGGRLDLESATRP